MRLTEYQVSSILNAFRRHFGPTASLWLFGSRVDDTARGGDIDLYIQTTDSNPDLLVKAKIDFLIELDKQLGEQKIDVVLHRVGQTKNLSIYEIAQKTGIKLA